jgi:hypothetical protein
LKTLTYLFIRMWAPPEECSDPEEPHYVTRVDNDGGDTQWTVTRDFEKANYFTSLRVAKRVVGNVRRITERLKNGWHYEIYEVVERLVATDIQVEKEEVA